MNNKRLNDMILQLDNKEIITSFKLSNGFILYTQVRYVIYKKLLEDNQNITENLKNNVPVKKNYLNTLYNIVTLFLNSTYFVSDKYKALVFSSSMACYKGIGGVYKSKINDFTNKLAIGKILNIFQSINGKYFEGYRKPYAYYEAIYLKSLLQSKLNPNTPSIDFKTIDKFIDFLKLEIGDFINESFFETLKNDLFEFAKTQYYLYDNYFLLLKRLNPKFIIVEDGNYGGGDKTTLIWCANQLGIKTIEVQHGVFDFAYKYSHDLVNNKEFSDFKTNYLFTMGKYWTEYTNISSKTFELGYPFLEEKINSIIPKKDNSLLFISQGNITNSLKPIAKEIANISKYKVIFRLHPNENVNDYNDLKSFNIEISNAGDIHQLIANSDAIVGSYSTVIFETLLFDRKIFIHKNKLSDEYIPQDIGIRFNNASEILNCLITDNNLKSNKGDYWALNWKENIAEINHLEKLW
jgi:hypothetical protein